MDMPDKQFNEISDQITELRDLINILLRKAVNVEMWRKYNHAHSRVESEGIKEDADQALALVELIEAKLDFEGVLRSADDEDTDHDTYLLAKNDLVIAKHRWAAVST